jgi:hypothetical protein
MVAAPSTGPRPVGGAGTKPSAGIVSTTAVILIVATENPQAAWQQPLLRLADSAAGVAVGIACKWIASFLFFHVRGEEVR